MHATHTHNYAQICTDCAHLIANAQTPEDWNEDQTDHWLARIADRNIDSNTHHWTLGHPQQGDHEHTANHCHTWTDNNYCTCEPHYGTSPCHHCGDHQAGNRHPATHTTVS